MLCSIRVWQAWDGDGTFSSSASPKQLMWSGFPFFLFSICCLLHINGVFLPAFEIPPSPHHRHQHHPFNPFQFSGPVFVPGSSPEKRYMAVCRMVSFDFRLVSLEGLCSAGGEGSEAMGRSAWRVVLWRGNPIRSSKSREEGEKSGR